MNQKFKTKKEKSRTKNTQSVMRKTITSIKSNSKIGDQNNRSINNCIDVSVSDCSIMELGGYCGFYPTEYYM